MDRKGLIITLLSTFLASQLFCQAEHAFVNGSLYQDHFPGSLGHPFFLQENWQKGLVISDGEAYPDQALKYDLHIDRLIYNHVHPEGVFPIKLNPQYIEGFELQGHRFIWLNEFGSPAQGPPGYVEILVEGKVILYQRWSKRFNPSAHQSRGEFSPYQERYISRDGQFYKVAGKSSLLKILSDQEKALRSFMRKNKLLPGSEDPLHISKVVHYYNSLP
jgi:hypothetical protein